MQYKGYSVINCLGWTSTLQTFRFFHQKFFSFLQCKQIVAARVLNRWQTCTSDHFSPCSCTPSSSELIIEFSNQFIPACMFLFCFWENRLRSELLRQPGIFRSITVLSGSRFHSANSSSFVLKKYPPSPSQHFRIWICDLISRKMQLVGILEKTKGCWFTCLAVCLLDWLVCLCCGSCL